MSNLRNTLSQIESKLQSLVEDNLLRLFSSYNQTKDLSDKLITALKSGIKLQPTGEMIAPNLFSIHIPPDKEEDYKANENFLDELAESIQEVADQLGLKFVSPPVIRFVVEQKIAEANQVTAQISRVDLNKTSTLEQSSVQEASIVPLNAYLIVNGSQVFTLENNVTNIGRRSDNHLVINDVRISRVHAQIRLVKGKFVIFDLESLGGVFINNQRINQAVLYPGDVISLAGISLVYGQESPNMGETQRLSSLIDG